MYFDACVRLRFFSPCHFRRIVAAIGRSDGLVLAFIASFLNFDAKNDDWLYYYSTTSNYICMDLPGEIDFGSRSIGLMMRNASAGRKQMSIDGYLPAGCYCSEICSRIDRKMKVKAHIVWSGSGEFIECGLRAMSSTKYRLPVIYLSFSDFLWDRDIPVV